MEVLSPVTGRHGTEPENKISKEKILSLYSELGIDVSRFFSNINEVEIRKCLATGYRFYYPFSIFGDDQFYSDLQKALPGYYVSRWEHEKALELIPAGAKLLEVGSGSGYFLQQLKKKGVEAEGLELNTTAKHDATSKGLVVHQQLLEEFSDDHAGKFDFTCSFQVLEHITEVGSFIEHSIKILKPGGKIIIGVPFNNPYIFRHDVYHTLNLPPHHAGLWNEDSFRRLPAHFPLQVEKVMIEPLREFKEWFSVQKNHYKHTNKPLAALFGLLPRPLYKVGLKMLSPFIHGRNILVVLKKSGNE